MRWRIVLEEYNPQLIYLKGEHNIVAGVLSRLNLLSDSSEDYLVTQKNELQADIYPLQMSLLGSEQHKDTSIKNTLRDRNSNYIREEVRVGSKRYEVVFCNGWIVVPLIDWYHTTLMHPGINRTKQTIKMHLHRQSFMTKSKKYARFARSANLRRKRTWQIAAKRGWS